MENNFAGKTACSLPWSRGKIHKSFSPKLTDYFIQGVRKQNENTIFRKFIITRKKIMN
jgi:hypothetical protein